MRLRHIKGCEEFVENSRFTETAPEQKKGKWPHPLHVEIGMGKGIFLRELAKQNPDVFYIGIERYESVIQKAIERIEREDPVPENVRFICMDAEKLRDVFADGEIDRIYLNFSDPWPKPRHENRRLTSPRFMKLYESVLCPDGQIEFKTDNNEFFEYSLESVPAAGWQLTFVTRDLHHEDVPNVMTEYEEKFSAQGNAINKLVAKFPQKVIDK